MLSQNPALEQRGRDDKQNLALVGLAVLLWKVDHGVVVADIDVFELDRVQLFHRPQAAIPLRRDECFVSGVIDGLDHPNHVLVLDDVARHR